MTRPVREANAAGDLGRPAPPAPRAHCLLLSGGLDSATLAAWIKQHNPGEPITAYTFMYGQKHSVELEAARAVAAFYDLEHQVRELQPIQGSALTDEAAEVPLGRDMTSSPGVAPTYVPARNLLFLVQVASIQDAVGPASIWLGVHRDDLTGYPDCRPEFIAAADEAVQLGTQHELRVQAPFVHLPKAEILRWGLTNGVPYELTHSCYQGRQPACGVCDTCQARLLAFAEVGTTDPLAYDKDPQPGAGTAGGVEDR